MTEIRKPIAFDTTVRNPQRLAQFVSILKNFEGNILTKKLTWKIEANLFIEKIVNPTMSTLGTYKTSMRKFQWNPSDTSKDAPNNVQSLFKKWKKSTPGSFPVKEMMYLLSNTSTDHKETTLGDFDGGWGSRFNTQYRFATELGLVYLEKDKPVKISENGNLLIKDYKNGHIVDEHDYDASNDTSAFLNAFSRYQTNNPYRKNTIKVNFFPLFLNLIMYTDKNFRHGISKKDLSFLISWKNNNYKELAKYINNFRKKFHYNNVSNETTYEHAMNLLDDETSNDIIPATKEFMIQNKKRFKMEQITIETVDDMFRKLYYTHVIILIGAGRFIDVNTNEIDKIKFIIQHYSKNRDFESKQEYFKYMGKVEEKLIFNNKIPISEKEKSSIQSTLTDWSKELKWDDIKMEMQIACHNGRESQNSILKLLNNPVRLEFLTAIALNKALPLATVQPNYHAGNDGIPYSTAPGATSNRAGADIDIFENEYHAIAEPTVDASPAWQRDHELPSVYSHLVTTIDKDKDNNTNIQNWFAIYLSKKASKDLGTMAGYFKFKANVDIAIWEVDDFVNYSKDNVNNLRDYNTIRVYAKMRKPK